MSDPTGAPGTRWAPRFLLIWSGQAFSLFGSALVQFALVWWLTRRTGSAAVLAAASMAGMLPQILLGPFVGTLVDRWDRRLLMIVSDSAIALATLGLAVLFHAGAAEPWMLYAVMAWRSACGAFHHPSMNAAMPLLVPKGQLARVAGLNQTLQGLVSIAAPPTGAFLIGVLPTEAVLLIDVATAAPAVAPLLFVRIPSPPRQGGGEAKATTYFQDLRAGYSYIAGWPGLLAVMLLACLLNFLLTPTGSLLPLLVTRRFGLGPMELGAAQSALGVGMIAGGLLLGAWGGFRKRIVTTLTGVIGLGAGVFAMGLAPASAFGLCLAAAAFMGFMLPVANGPLQAILQAAVRPDMLGRVSSLTGSVSSAMAPLGLIAAAAVAEFLGVRAWYLAAGGLCILIASSAALLPAVMRIEENRRAGAG